jgi:hypothetical protein
MYSGWISQAFKGTKVPVAGIGAERPGRPAWDATLGKLLGAAPQKSQSSFSCFVVGTFPMHTAHR